MECQFCHKEFKRPCGLAVHERTCKDNPNRKPLENHVCNFNYNGGKSSKSDGWTCSICGLKFRIRSELKEHRKTHAVKQNHFCECRCQFCGKVSTSKEGNTQHEKFCKSNENHIHSSLLGKQIPLEIINQWKLNGRMGGYRKNSGRGKRGYYNGLCCMSSWELAWVVYQIEHGLTVQQCTERFEYIMDDRLHHYTPDFIIDNTYYEIKNWHRPDTEFKVKFFPKEKTLILIEGYESNKVFLDYAEKKYGKEFWTVLYEPSKMRS